MSEDEDDSDAECTPFSSKRSKESHPYLTEEQQEMALNVLNVLQTSRKSPSTWSAILEGSTTEITAKLCGVSESTIKRLQRCGYPREHAKIPGRPSHVTEGLASEIRGYILERIFEGKVATAQNVREHLRRTLAYSPSDRHLRRIIRKIGFKWLRGDVHNTCALKSEIFDSACQFCLQMKQARVDDKPRIPEVYLDESFIEIGSRHPKSWLDPFLPRHTPGRLGRFNIVGAGIITYRDGVLHGEFVHDSLRAWDTTLKQPTAKNKIFTNEYQGNFTQLLFEKWFTSLCETLKLKYGACNIYMHGSSVHKGLKDPFPTVAWDKSSIQKWTVDRQLQIDPTLSKVEMIRQIKDALPPRTLKVKQIAESNGHQAFFLPPYHPELNPIEKIWADIKWHVQEANAEDKKSTLQAITEACRESVSTETWVGAWNAANKRAEQLLKIANLDKATFFTSQSSSTRHRQMMISAKAKRAVTNLFYVCVLICHGFLGPWKPKRNFFATRVKFSGLVSTVAMF